MRSAEAQDEKTLILEDFGATARPVRTTANYRGHGVQQTNAEEEIFARLASGKRNHVIARELSLSTNTISNHVASILAKLHIDNRIQRLIKRQGVAVRVDAERNRRVAVA